MSVREELERLSRLQELDLKIDRARMLVTSAPQAFANIEKELATENANFLGATQKKLDLEKQKRQLETDIVMDNDRIKNIESRLGAVTNNKEFHAASKESDKAKKAISDREKLVSDLATKITDQDRIMAEIQVKIDALNGVLETKRSEVGTQVSEADKEIASYAGDRSSIVAEITPPVMSRYNRIRKVYSDAIAIVSRGNCSCCNVSLPPQMYIQVQKGLELLTCPSCQRLLYYKVQ
jgi:predicted  nucleic acid-binding Zn-ribbon protein